MRYGGYGYYGRPVFRFGPELTEWVKLLIIANAGVFLLQQIVGPRMLYTFGLVPAEAVRGLKLWQFVTHMFLHAGFFHILFNMFMLWMFGSDLERDWGPDTFIRFYLFTGVGAGFTHWLTAPNSTVPVVGASGALFGILLAYAMAYPDRMVLVYFFIPVKVKHLVLFLGIMNFLAAIQYTGGSGVAHFAHLGGLLFGYIYIKWFGVGPWGGGRAPRLGLSGLTRAYRRWRAKRRLRVVYMEEKRRAQRKAQVDRILEKIAREGIDSLTREEREILERESSPRDLDA